MDIIEEKKDKNCTSSLSSNSESDTDDYDERNAASSPDCNSDSPDPFFDSFQKSSPFVLPLDRAKEALRRKLEKCNPIDSLQKKIDTKLHECSDLPFLRYQTGAKEALLSSMSMFTEESIDALIDDDDVGDNGGPGDGCLDDDGDDDDDDGCDDGDGGTDDGGSRR